MDEFSDLTDDPPVVALLRRRWVIGIAAGMALALVAATAYYQRVVAPTLTSTRFELSVDGRNRPSAVGVNDEMGVVTVSDGQNGLSEMALSGGSLFVLASEVGLGDVGYKWVEVPLALIDPRYRALTPSRVLSALSREVKECKRPSSDASIITGLLFGVSDEGVSLCGRGSGHADSTRWIADERAVRPSALADIPTSSVVALREIADSDAVLAALNHVVAESAA